MSTKTLIIGLAIIVAIVALAALLWNQLKPSAPASVSTDEASLIDDQLSALSEEELAKVTDEQTEFNKNVEDSIASDMGNFYY